MATDSTSEPEPPSEATDGASEATSASKAADSTSQATNSTTEQARGTRARRASESVRRRARLAPRAFVMRYEQAEKTIFRAVDLDEDLPTTDEARAEHFAAMLAFHKSDVDSWMLQEWLHMNLTVLDYKAQSTLSFSGLGIAALTFVASKFGPGTSIVLRVAVAIALFLLVWSAARLSKFNFVVWSSTDDYHHPDRLVDDLLSVRDERTRIVRACWARNLVALLLLLLVLLYDLFFGT